MAQKGTWCRTEAVSRPILTHKMSQQTPHRCRACESGHDFVDNLVKNGHSISLRPSLSILRICVKWLIRPEPQKPGQYPRNIIAVKILDCDRMDANHCNPCEFLTALDGPGLKAALLPPPLHKSSIQTVFPQPIAASPFPVACSNEDGC